ncbi:uncharacterized protein BDZ99DRAFT_456584 [Mytilinidion resinicola]|uniref:Uncharacterized protein n=1 Tax=Mytilinidion resinicola TaxID=574789 RepID=A0A6A6Z905_9PEZI|nr:uncharacterized protein BDZ99DRAFT_456584 [Mytilinidion resinicola]KAF2816765.1 hypothetical protein BDZ99DRAFT_456584 [Mytilinidion resinicola]
MARTERFRYGIINELRNLMTKTDLLVYFFCAFEDASAWATLSRIFTIVLHDPNLNSKFLTIDALDK